MFKLKTVLASALTAAVLATGTSAALAQACSTTRVQAAHLRRVRHRRHGRRRGPVQHACNSADRGRPRRYAQGPGTVHRLRADGRGFRQDPAAQLNALLADKAALTKVLTYHVSVRRIVAADVKTGQVKTVEGQFLNVTASSMA